MAAKSILERNERPDVFNNSLDSPNFVQTLSLLAQQCSNSLEYTLKPDLQTCAKKKQFAMQLDMMPQTYRLKIGHYRLKIDDRNFYQQIWIIGNFIRGESISEAE